MEKLVRLIGRDIYIRLPNLETMHLFKEWVEPYSDDPYFDLGQPFSDYQNIFRIPHNNRYNMNRLASQVGLAITNNE